MATAAARRSAPGSDAELAAELAPAARPASPCACAAPGRSSRWAPDAQPDARAVDRGPRPASSSTTPAT